MRPVAVVMLDVLVKDDFEMSTTEDEDPVETFSSYRADEALSEGVGTGRSNRSPDDPDAPGEEDLVEAGGELGVAISDQEPDGPGTVGELIGQVPSLLEPMLQLDELSPRPRTPGECRVR
jgi:hypothetical protein